MGILKRVLHETAQHCTKLYVPVWQISYWRQFEHGMISADAVRTLVGSTEVAADMEGAFLSIDELRKSWEVGSMLNPCVKPLLTTVIMHGTWTL